MNKVLCLHCHSLGDEIVFDGWVHLHNVSSLASHVEVVQCYVVCDVCQFSRPQDKNVGAILEGSPKLRSVDGKLQWNFVIRSFHDRIVLDWRTEDERKKSYQRDSLVLHCTAFLRIIQQN